MKYIFLFSLCLVLPELGAGRRDSGNRSDVVIACEWRKTSCSGLESFPSGENGLLQHRGLPVEGRGFLQGQDLLERMTAGSPFSLFYFRCYY